MSQSEHIPQIRVRRAAKVLLASLGVTALIAGACTDSGDPPIAAGPGEVAIGLRTDLSCDELVEATRAEVEALMERNRAMDRMTSQELNRSQGAFNDEMAVEADAVGGAAAPSAAADDGSGAAGEVIAGTNQQETGVDEGDILKTDGTRLVALSGTTIRVVQLDGSPEVDGTLVLPSAVEGDVGEIFLRGDEAIVLIPTWGDRLPTEPGPANPGSELRGESGAPDSGSDGAPVAADTSVVPFEQGLRVVRVDLSDATSPEMIEERVVEGGLVASRMVDGTVRVVVRAPLPIAEDMWALRDDADVDELFSGIDAQDLLPAVSSDGEVSALGGCGDLAVLPSGQEAEAAMPASAMSSYAMEPNTVTVLTIGDELDEMSPVSVSGLADIVYASTDSLYVTNTGWGESGPSTFVHRFDTSGAEPAEYTGSGIVPGRPLNQYSLSESGEQLRIVTTTEDQVALEQPFIEDGPVDEMIEPAPREFVPPTEGRLTVLSPTEEGTLAEIGSVEDLGVGEEVQSVRFLGDMAYVVTFRQTDPLYAIDLSDPTDPRALGELKITGFSQYLHPVGEGLLLGIGREATDEGMDIGFKASLFDVSDPTNPTEVDKWVVPGAHSEVGNDPHAFTWDPVAGHAIFPLQDNVVAIGPELPQCPPEADCAPGPPQQPIASAVVLSVGPDGIDEVARLTHDSPADDPWIEQIRRSVVVDRDLWTMSHTGLELTDADAPSEGMFVAF